MYSYDSSEHNVLCWKSYRRKGTEHSTTSTTFTVDVLSQYLHMLLVNKTKLYNSLILASTNSHLNTYSLTVALNSEIQARPALKKITFPTEA